MTVGSPRDLARLARRSYLEALRRRAGELVAACAEGARLLASQSAEPVLYARRRDLVMDWPRYEAIWREGLVSHLSGAIDALSHGLPPMTSPAALAVVAQQFSLVDDSVVELDMIVSRLGQVISDKAGWQYTDLCSRLQGLEPGADRPDQVAGDVLRPTVVARWLVDSWVACGLSADHWKTLQNVLHDEVAHVSEEAYHEANKVLLDHGVAPEIDLRPFIRRTVDAGLIRPMAPSMGVAAARGGASGAGHGMGGGGGATGSNGSAGSGGFGLAAGSGGRAAAHLTGESNRVTAAGRLVQGQGSYEETRLMTQAPGLARTPAQSQAVLGKLNQLVARQVPGFDQTAPQGSSAMGGGAMAPALGQALSNAQQAVRLRVDADGAAPNPQGLARDLQAQKRELKEAAATPAERATIEIVALLFQSILMDERLPAAVRVWFARLQMPVLRVAVSEPDFFATLDHPARLLIDRMGGCVMGFAGGGEVAGAEGELQGDVLHKEIKRIVQTVEAYPDTGRRVFQTVLIEFERFLEKYFREGNEASRKGVSLAQQLEQREAFAIQYTIELRKMLDAVPVHEGIREFLFKVWADVLAQSAVLTAPASDETKDLQRMAGDLIWSASAKTTREERNLVLQRLPPLLKLLRAGMAKAGMPLERQDEHMKTLNAALQAAFTAKSAAISPERLRDVTRRLAALDEVLPDMGEVELDTDLFRDLSGYEQEDLEVVADGGTMATPAMQAWAKELKLGAWFMLDYRGRQESVQLAWRGMHKQLTLFVTPQGRGVLFQLHRLSAFLQAGLLVPAEEESLTVRATRDALAKLDADPARLLS
jgi:hypothetical protein